MRLVRTLSSPDNSPVAQEIPAWLTLGAVLALAACVVVLLVTRSRRH